MFLARTQLTEYERGCFSRGLVQIGERIDRSSRPAVAFYASRAEISDFFFCYLPTRVAAAKWDRESIGCSAHHFRLIARRHQSNPTSEIILSPPFPSSPRLTDFLLFFPWRSLERRNFNSTVRAASGGNNVADSATTTRRSPFLHSSSRTSSRDISRRNGRRTMKMVPRSGEKKKN